ncbi:MAG: hypothetical protein U9Q74_07125 [Gemmatimonadota bacterium]|nr:hypothetical protein [Gemmatimonadota bacterium]
MRLMSFLLVLALAPGAAGAQEQAKPAQPEPKALLATMQVNVGRISPSLEHDRWSANLILWQARLDHPGKLSATVLANMRESATAIANIVARIQNPAERERWDANRDLWDLYLADAGAPSAATRAKMRAAGDNEGERRENRSLWRERALDREPRFVGGRALGEVGRA